MKKILVTGAKGQLGSCIHQLVNEEKNDSLQFIFTDSEELDITNSEKLTEFFLQNTFDYVVNCAAYTAVDKAESEPEKAENINANAVKYLSQHTKNQNATLIHVSTDYVFDGNKIGSYNINDTPNPINVYGKTKLLGEKFAQENNPKTFIIRTSWVYSEYGNNFVKTMRKLFKERKELSIVNDQIGKPTNAIKLAQKIIEIIGNNNTNYGLYHYASDDSMTWFQFAQRIKNEEKSDIILHPITTEQYPTPAKRPKNSVLEVNL